MSMAFSEDSPLPTRVRSVSNVLRRNGGFGFREIDSVMWIVACGTLRRRLTLRSQGTRFSVVPIAWRWQFVAQSAGPFTGL
jgi:hypothetical protein